MGCYINPPNQMKEQWLIDNAEGFPKASTTPFAEATKDNKLPVCLIFNGTFTAAGIAYSEEEYKVFLRSDGRVKLWFLADKEKLKEVSFLEDYLKEAKS